MMALIPEVVSFIHNLLSSENGISKDWGAGLEAIGQGNPSLAAEQIVTNQMPAQLLANLGSVRYPRFQIYCDRVENSMREKFNRFSGTAQVTVEIQHSHERWEALTSALPRCAQLVTDVVETHRGEVMDGVFLSGKYTVTIDPPKVGGRGFLQVAKIVIPVEVTRA